MTSLMLMVGAAGVSTTEGPVEVDPRQELEPQLRGKFGPNRTLMIRGIVDGRELLPAPEGIQTIFPGRRT